MARAEFKVFRSVIVSNMVKMMDLLALSEQSAQFSFHNQDMLVNDVLMGPVVTGSPYQTVAVLIKKGTSALPHWVIFSAPTNDAMFSGFNVGVVAGPLAKVSSTKFSAPFSELFTALGAIKFNFTVGYMFHTNNIRGLA